MLLSCSEISDSYHITDISHIAYLIIPSNSMTHAVFTIYSTNHYNIKAAPLSEHNNSHFVQALDTVRIHFFPLLLSYLVIQ